MRRALLLMFLMFLVAASLSENPPGAAHQGILIEGPRDFRGDVERALRLIERCSPGQFADVSRFVRSVRLTRSRPAPGVAAYCDRNQRVYVVRDHYLECMEQARAHPMAFYALPSLIIHETVHLKQITVGQDPASGSAELEALQAERLLRSRLAQAPFTD